jgi:hypothetical protein
LSQRRDDNPALSQPAVDRGVIQPVADVIRAPVDVHDRRKRTVTHRLVHRDQEGDDPAWLVFELVRSHVVGEHMAA